MKGGCGGGDQQVDAIKRSPSLADNKWCSVHLQAALLSLTLSRRLRRQRSRDTENQKKEIIHNSSKNKNQIKFLDKQVDGVVGRGGGAWWREAVREREQDKLCSRFKLFSLH